MGGGNGESSEMALDRGLLIFRITQVEKLNTEIGWIRLIYSFISFHKPLRTFHE